MDDVAAAQTGDGSAYARLVEQFRDAAFSYAYAWVKDAGLAEDVCQDAFIDAWLKLPQLRDPAAFSGWLRRIVRKHCDRRTRTGQAEMTSPELLEAESPAQAQTQVLSDREDLRWLDQALADLPEHERIVAALHYLGGQTQQAVATFLELPLTTVKKRLHSVRTRFRARSAGEAQRRPRVRDTFADRIRLFIAIRDGDVEHVEHVLRRQPTLLEAPEQWTAEEALAGGIPLAHRLTPLVLAAGRGDTRIVQKLLALGANPDGACGCPGAETALWAAALAGHAEVVRLLHQAGADTTVRNQAGFSVADVAALHGHRHVLQILDEGVKEVPRDGPKILASQLPLETGIKALDLLAPLHRGMLVQVHGAAETGLMVLLAELTRRLGLRGLTSAWLTGTSRAWQGSELAALSRAYGVDPFLSERARAQAHFIFVAEGEQARVEADLEEHKAADAIVFIVSPWTAVTRGDASTPALRAPYDALICTDSELARCGVYPALDARRCASRLPLEASHERVRQLVVQHATRPGVREYFAQPFEVYRHQTGQPGEWVPFQDTLRGFESRLPQPVD